MAIEFLREGLQRGERLLLVADLDSEDALLAAVADLGDVRSLAETGTLSTLPTSNLHRGSGSFDRPSQVATFRDLTRAAVADGYSGLRLVGEATVLVGSDAELERFTEYELDVDRMVARERITALCAYNAAAVPQAARQLASVHPCRCTADDPGFCLSQTGDGLKLSGEVDMTNGDLFVRVLQVASVTEPDEVCIDLRDLQFIHVAGLSALDTFGSRLQGEGRRLVLTDPSGLVVRCLEVLGLQHLAQAIGAA